MAQNYRTLLQVLLLALVLAATSSSADDQPPCNSFMSVLPCQSAATSETVNPSPDCCSALQKFHDADCLCNVMLAAQSAAGMSHIPFNLKAALQIPMKCSLKTINAPQGYSCGGMVVPRSAAPSP